MKSLTVAMVVSSASAFTSRSAPSMSFNFGGKPKAAPAAATPAKINGWAADSSEFCYGLPGSISPLGNFDPLGLSTGKSLDEIKRFREAETQHGRVAMLAALGFLVGENYHPLFGLDGKEILAIDSLTEVRLVFPVFFEILAVVIGGLELNRALKGWTNPQLRDGPSKATVLLSSYYPGDVGFDPLGLKPKTDDEFIEKQTKELNNGRLAMIAVAGFVAQELVDRKPILFNDFGFGTLLDSSNPLY